MWFSYYNELSIDIHAVDIDTVDDNDVDAGIL